MSIQQFIERSSQFRYLNNDGTFMDEDPTKKALDEVCDMFDRFVITPKRSDVWDLTRSLNDFKFDNCYSSEIDRLVVLEKKKIADLTREVTSVDREIKNIKKKMRKGRYGRKERMLEKHMDKLKRVKKALKSSVSECNSKILSYKFSY